VSENRVQRRIFDPKREEVAGGWRRLHNEELDNLYTSPNVIRVIKSRRMRCAGRVARMREMRNAHNIWSEIPKGRDHSEDRGVDGRIIQECNETFSGYQPRQVSVLNRRFEDQLGHHHHHHHQQQQQHP
jgi:hypothetical protein